MSMYKEYLKSDAKFLLEDIARYLEDDSLYQKIEKAEGKKGNILLEYSRILLNVMNKNGWKAEIVIKDNMGYPVARNYSTWK